jgi:predicted CoA-binding protein
MQGQDVTRMSATISAPSDEELKQILEETETIAVVGWSDNKERPSHATAEYLQKRGYRVIPVNPRLAGETWGDQPIYATLADIPEPVDLVDVFRRAEHTPAHAREAVEAGAKVLWLQLGIRNDEARRIAGEGGMVYVEDRCTHIEHLRLIRGYPVPSSPDGT